MFQIQNQKVRKLNKYLLEKALGHLIFRSYLFCFICIILDLIFTIVVLLIEESFIKENYSISFTIKKIIIFSSIFIFVILILLLIRKAILSKILMYIYIIISGLYLLVDVIIKLNQMMVSEEETIFISEYSESKFDIIIFTISLSTIFIKLFAFYNLKEYIEILKKRENLILDNQHEKFLDELNKTFNNEGSNILGINNQNNNNDIDNSLINNNNDDILCLYIKQRDNFK